jgi:hypothetical protein
MLLLKTFATVEDDVTNDKVTQMARSVSAPSPFAGRPASRLSIGPLAEICIVVLLVVLTCFLVAI